MTVARAKGWRSGRVAGLGVLGVCALILLGAAADLRQERRLEEELARWQDAADVLLEERSRQQLRSRTAPSVPSMLVELKRVAFPPTPTNTVRRARSLEPAPEFLGPETTVREGVVTRSTFSVGARSLVPPFSAGSMVVRGTHQVLLRGRRGEEWLAEGDEYEGWEVTHVDEGSVILFRASPRRGVRLPLELSGGHRED